MDVRSLFLMGLGVFVVFKRFYVTACHSNKICVNRDVFICDFNKALTNYTILIIIMHQPSI